MNKIPQNKSTSTGLRSMTRLMIGGVEIGLNRLLSSLESWDQELAQRDVKGQGSGGASNQTESVPPPGMRVSLPTETESKAEEEALAQGEAPPLLRYALVGLFFDVQDGLVKGIEAVDRTSRAVIHMGEPWLRPLQQSRLIKPLSRQVDRLVARGEAEVMRWVERGRQESEQSRKLVETAVSSTIEQSIETLATNPEVQELVQKQSTGLANEVLEEVRERTVSADNFLEGVIRRILRRTPREQLPAPPPEVIERAAARSQKGK